MMVLQEAIDDLIGLGPSAIISAEKINGREAAAARWRGLLSRADAILFKSAVPSFSALLALPLSSFLHHTTLL